MQLQQPQHAGFVRAHLATKADDVGEHDRGQPASLSPLASDRDDLPGHGSDLWRRVTFVVKSSPKMTGIGKTDICLRWRVCLCAPSVL